MVAVAGEEAAGERGTGRGPDEQVDVVFAPLVNELLNYDRYCVLADFDAYAAAQQEAGRAYADTSRWGTMSLLNTARSGKFSSDRTIRQYCEDIWKLPVGNG